MSHVETIKTFQASVRASVLDLLKWSELEYGDFLMAQGEAYLSQYIGEDVWGLVEIKHSEHFWKWWKNHWYDRDIDFVSEAEKMNVSERRLYYAICHETSAIVFSPKNALMHRTFLKQVIAPVCSSGGE
jgi:hypothetical protein